MLSSSTPTPTAATTGTAGDQNSSNSTLKLHNRLSSSSSSSFSTFSSKTAPAPPPATTASNSGSSAAWTKTMEEVWKDINLASLNDQNTRPITTTNTFGSGIMFQDFLARPFTINDPPNSNNNTTPSPSYSSSSASPTPHRLTALSLGSRPDFHFDHHHHPSLRPNGVHVQHNYNHNHNQNHPANSSKACFSANPSSPFDPFPCSSSLPCFESKRFAEPADANPGDRRNKRMIKNRESAARSRARKQEKLAYTNELQLKVDHLLEENARLKRQQQQLREAAASQQKKKSSLYRTSTAPF